MSSLLISRRIISTETTMQLGHLGEQSTLGTQKGYGHWAAAKPNVVLPLGYYHQTMGQCWKATLRTKVKV